MRAAVALALALALGAGAALAQATAIPWRAVPLPPERFAAPDAAVPPPMAAPAREPVAVRGLCADSRLEGRLRDPVEAEGHCGIPLPVEVTHILGVAFEPPLLINCRTARATAEWMARGPVRMAPELLGAPLVSVRVGGSYACRTRNFLGGRLSEHAAGNAVDLSGFRTADGREVTLIRDWRKGAAGEFLLQAWRAACGPFGTVLGPDHDARHADHFHFDTASRTGGPLCR